MESGGGGVGVGQASDFIVDIIKYTCELPTRRCRGEPKENPQKNEPGYTVVILQKNLSPNKTSIYRKLYNVEWAKAPLAASILFNKVENNKESFTNDVSRE